MKMKIYWAAPLFTAAEREFNRQVVAQVMSQAQPDDKFDMEIRLPQIEVAGMDIFTQNYNDVRYSDLVIAVVDGPDVDSGTAFEVGVARATGIPVWLVSTDFRSRGDDNTCNLMIERSADLIILSDSRGSTIDDLARDIYDQLRRNYG